MRISHNLVYLFLFLGELPAYRGHAGVVRTVVLVCLSSAVAKHQTPGFQGTWRGVAMLNLTVHGKYALETHSATAREGYARYVTCNLLFGDSRTAHPHRSGVHIVTNSTCTLNLRNLFGTLHHALLNYSLDESQRSLFSLF